MPTAQLRAGHVQPIWAGHPWVYAQAIEHVQGGAEAGDEIDVTDPRGNFLGRGFYSPKSALPIRILTRSPTQRLDGAFFRERLATALEERRAFGFPNTDTTGYRLVHSDGDHLSGLVVDVFGDTVALQFLTLGMRRAEGLVLTALGDLLKPKAILDRTPEKTAKLEGFAPRPPVLRGEDVSSLRFVERRFSFELPGELTQKTGYYFDQRALRARVETLARGKRVLDAYSFVGSFALAAARGGAEEVVCVDENVLALETALSLAKHHGLVLSTARADARAVLGDAHASFDMVLVDPPRLAPSRGAKEKALHHYAKLVELGCKATKPGGLLVFSSCSAAVDLGSLTRALATGALRANTVATVLERHFQDVDHPVLAAHPEGLYLKSLIARITPREGRR